MRPARCRPLPGNSTSPPPATTGTRAPPPGPGGDLGFQERNDHLEDVFWIWTGADVGSRDPARLFMEVHNYPTPNRTACNGTWNPIHDQCFGVFPAGALPIEIIVVRCTEPLEDPMQLEITFDPPETLTTEPVFGDLRRMRLRSTDPGPHGQGRPAGECYREAPATSGRDGRSLQGS